MKRNLSGQDILAHIEALIAARLPTQDQAHEEFNKGVKFVTDYVSEFINIEVKAIPQEISIWRKFLRIILNAKV